MQSCLIGLFAGEKRPAPVPEEKVRRPVGRPRKERPEDQAEGPLLPEAIRDELRDEIAQLRKPSRDELATKVEGEMSKGKKEDGEDEAEEEEE